MADPPIQMDTSTAAIKSALLSSNVVHTKILLLESIEVEERKNKYTEFLNAEKWTNKKEFIGFMPLQSFNLTDVRFLRALRTFFSGGVRAPGRLHPFFGSLDRGVCVSQRLDTVFTVMEEEVDYWVVVCAVAYDADAIKQTPLFSLSDSPPQAMQWNGDIQLIGESPGWARHLECIETVIYAGETAPCDHFPRNVHALAVAKVQFCKREGILWTNNILDKPEIRMKRGNHKLTFKEHTTKTTCGNGFFLEGLSIMGVRLHSRYHIEDDEWPDYLHFYACDSFTTVFKTWIMDGKLDIQKLLNEGSVKMLMNDFYDHNRGCLPPHPAHVYLNYFEVEVPKEEMQMMIKRMVDLDAKHVILFGCVPLIKFRGHAIYAAIPSGELANRLGLPTIAGGRFHLVQALPVPRGIFKMMDTKAEMLDLFSRPPYAAPAGVDDGCWEKQCEVVDLSSDSDKGRGSPATGGEEPRREENQAAARPVPGLRPAAPAAPVAAAARQPTDVLQPLQLQQWAAGVASGSRPDQQGRSFVPVQPVQQLAGMLPSGAHPHALLFPFLAPPPSTATPPLIAPPMGETGMDGSRYRPVSPPPFTIPPRFPPAEAALARPVPAPSIAPSYVYSDNRMEATARPPFPAHSSQPLPLPQLQPMPAAGSSYAVQPPNPQPSFPSQPSLPMYAAVALAALDEPAAARRDNQPAPVELQGAEKYRAEMAEMKKKEAELRKLAFGSSKEAETRKERDGQAPSRSRERMAPVVLGERRDNEVLLVSPPRGAIDRSARERRESERVDGESDEQRRRRKEKEQEEIMTKRGFGFLFDTEGETRKEQGEIQSQPTVASHRSGTESRREERGQQGRSRDRETLPRAPIDRSDKEKSGGKEKRREERGQQGGSRDRERADRRDSAALAESIEILDLSPPPAPVDRSDKEKSGGKEKRREEKEPSKRRSGSSFSNDTDGRGREGGEERRSRERGERRRRDSAPIGDAREVVDLSPPRAPVDQSDKAKSADKEKRKEERDEQGGSRSRERMDRRRRDSDDRSDEERSKKKEERSRRISAVFEDDNGNEVVALSPPRAAVSPVRTISGFRKMKISAAQHTRTARTGAPQEAASTEDTVVVLPPAPPTAPISTFGFRTMKIASTKSTLTARTTTPPSTEDTNDPSSFVVWHRESRGARVKSLPRLPPADVVIVIEDQLIKQMKSSELTPLIKMVNEHSSTVEKRILVVIHIEFDPDVPSSPSQLRSIEPAVLFVLDHDGENNNADQLQCCERLRGMREGDESGQMIYLTPNIIPTLSKNVELAKAGFKIFNTAGAVSFLQSREYEKQLEDY